MTRLILLALYVNEGHEKMIGEALKVWVEKIKAREAPIENYELVYGAYRAFKKTEPVAPQLMRYYDPNYVKYQPTPKEVLKRE